MEKGNLIPERKKEPQTAEIREDTEAMKYLHNGLCFVLWEEKTLRALRALRFNSFPYLH